MKLEVLGTVDEIATQIVWHIEQKLVDGAIQFRLVGNDVSPRYANCIFTLLPSGALKLNCSIDPSLPILFDGSQRRISIVKE